MARTIDNSQKIIDSRQIIARWNELREERRDLFDDMDSTNELQEWDEENGDELEALEKLNEQGEDSVADWWHGETLIREDHFEDYCEEMLVDCGDLPNPIPHYIVIDWEATADNIRQDYTALDYGGVTYLVRS